MKLKQCLENISPKEIKKLKIAYKKDETISLENLEYEILSSLIDTLIILTDTEINTLKSLYKNQDLSKVSPYLIDKGLVYKNKTKYILPEEILEVFPCIFDEEFQNSRLLLVISIYLSSNGAIKIKDLITLMAKSDVKISEKRLKTLAKSAHYKIKNNTIYLNEISEEIDKELSIANKNSKYHKIFDLKEILDLIYIKEEYFPNKISEVITKLINDKEKVEMLAQSTISYLTIGITDEMSLIDDILEGETKLNKKQKDKLLEILEEATDILPIWIDAGSCFLEDINAKEERQQRIKKYTQTKESRASLEEITKLTNYIIAYVTINGVITIDKLLEILENNHQIIITKETILDIVKQNDYIDVTKNYLNILENDNQMIKQLVELKNNFQEYKIINNPELALSEFDTSYNELEKILLKNKIPQNGVEVLLSLLMLRVPLGDELQLILQLFDVKLTKKQLNKLIKDLKEIKDNMQNWQLNGFKPNEINSIEPSKH